VSFRRIGGCLRFQDQAPLQALPEADANGVALIDAEASAGKDRRAKDIGTVVKRHEAEVLLGAEPLDAAEHDRFRCCHWPTLLGGEIAARGAEYLASLIAPLGCAARLIEI
jgi:hypothetical protein